MLFTTTGRHWSGPAMPTKPRSTLSKKFANAASFRSIRVFFHFLFFFSWFHHSFSVDGFAYTHIHSTTVAVQNKQIKKSHFSSPTTSRIYMYSFFLYYYYLWFSSSSLPWIVCAAAVNTTYGPHFSQSCDFKLMAQYSLLDPVVLTSFCTRIIQHRSQSSWRLVFIQVCCRVQCTCCFSYALQLFLLVFGWS